MTSHEQGQHASYIFSAWQAHDVWNGCSQRGAANGSQFLGFNTVLAMSTTTPILLPDSSVDQDTVSRRAEDDQPLPSDSPKDTKSGLSASAGAGIGVGAAVAVGILLVAAFIFFRRRRREKAAKPAGGDVEDRAGTGAHALDSKSKGKTRVVAVAPDNIGELPADVPPEIDSEPVWNRPQPSGGGQVGGYDGFILELEGTPVRQSMSSNTSFKISVCAQKGPNGTSSASAIKLGDTGEPTLEIWDTWRF